MRHISDSSSWFINRFRHRKQIVRQIRGPRTADRRGHYRRRACHASTRNNAEAGGKHDLRNTLRKSQAARHLRLGDDTGIGMPHAQAVSDQMTVTPFAHRFTTPQPLRIARPSGAVQVWWSVATDQRDVADQPGDGEMWCCRAWVELAYILPPRTECQIAASASRALVRSICGQ